MKLSYDKQTLGAFKRDTARTIKKLKETREPLVLTVNGKPELIVQEVESYRALLETIDRLAAVNGISRGLESMKAGRGKPLEVFMQDFKKKYGLDPEEE